MLRSHIETTRRTGNLSALTFARAFERIAREDKPVTADTALRLRTFFKTGAAFWMNIQARCDLETPKARSRRRSGRSHLTGRRENHKSRAEVITVQLTRECTVRFHRKQND